MAMNPPPPPGGQPPGYPPQSPGDSLAPPPGYVPFAQDSPGGGQRTNGLAVASLVLGIVGIILCVLFIPWILAIIFGSIAIKQCNDDPTHTGKGLAITGLVCGLVGGALVVLILVGGNSDFSYDFTATCSASSTDLNHRLAWALLLR